MEFPRSAHLGKYERAAANRLVQMQRDDIVRRIWKYDHTVWKPYPDEITNRLGWLNAPQTMQNELPVIHQLVDDVRAAGYAHVRVLGMGGASLAAEVFQRAWGQSPGYLDCAVIDSTHPQAVLTARSEIDLSKTLFIVSIKKHALETVSLFKYFYNAVAEVVGKQRAGAHFIAITDPGVWVNDLAAQYDFRQVCLNDPNIGGRYSPLTYVGLLPAALMGVDIDRFLALAQARRTLYGPDTAAVSHPGAWLGAVLGELARQGREKLTIITSDRLDGFADWAEQLVAESTGKEGTGILPVVHEHPVSPGHYSADRLFVVLEHDSPPVDSVWVQSVLDAGHPVLQFHLETPFDLAEQFYLWCFATAIAGYCLNINPFDQPNVESTKKQTRRLLDQVGQGNALPVQEPSVIESDIAMYSDHAGDTISDIVHALLGGLKPGDYIALQVYAPRTQALDAVVQELRQTLNRQTGCAVTSGYGPRFLHSTGQLHKGDKGNGLFIQLTFRSEYDVWIPDQAGEEAASLSFDTLIMAQALGDEQALKAASRRVIRFHLPGNSLDSISSLVEIVRSTQQPLLSRERTPRMK
jgi:transaldolase/glucose-6-phosphate isomerase